MCWELIAIFNFLKIRIRVDIYSELKSVKLLLALSIDINKLCYGPVNPVIYSVCLNQILFFHILIMHSLQ